MSCDTVDTANLYIFPVSQSKVASIFAKLSMGIVSQHDMWTAIYRPHLTVTANMLVAAGDHIIFARLIFRKYLIIQFLEFHRFTKIKCSQKLGVAL